MACGAGEWEGIPCCVTDCVSSEYGWAVWRGQPGPRGMDHLHRVERAWAAEKTVSGAATRSGSGGRTGGGVWSLLVVYRRVTSVGDH